GGEDSNNLVTLSYTTPYSSQLVSARIPLQRIGPYTNTSDYYSCATWTLPLTAPGAPASQGCLPFTLLRLRVTLNTNRVFAKQGQARCVPDDDPGQLTTLPGTSATTTAGDTGTFNIIDRSTSGLLYPPPSPP
ncbi:hypothetical protein HaLaN_14009, partial [Haematococcus lacustris]